MRQLPGLLALAIILGVVGASVAGLFLAAGSELPQLPWRYIGGVVRFTLLQAALSTGLSLVLGAAHAAKVPMPVAAAVFESFSLARAGEYGQSDFSGIADVVCDLARIERPRVPEGWKPA